MQPVAMDAARPGPACTAGGRRSHAHFVQCGQGRPVVLLHGIGASHHDWDELLPILERSNMAAYALDLLGHGESEKLPSDGYQMKWILTHCMDWVDSLGLAEAPVLIAHSLGGYLALEMARRFPERVRALVLANPFYRTNQLSIFLRRIRRRKRLTARLVKSAPAWVYKFGVDAASLLQGRDRIGTHSLSPRVRMQTVLDLQRTAPGVYHAPHTVEDLTPHLRGIAVPALVVWGDRDRTLAPASFDPLVAALPYALGACIEGAGHVLHQTHPREFADLVMGFLSSV